MKMIHNNGLFLHASAVVVNREALLFLGHSTAGKSTIARLLGEVYPSLADDIVFASRGSDGRWGVVDGGFRFGEGAHAEWQERIRSQIDKNSVPLRGCLRIHKAMETRIAPLDPVELARHLMDAVMEVDLQRKGIGVSDPTQSLQEIHHGILEARKMWFSQVAAMARQVRGWHLWFPLDMDIQEWNRLLVETLS